MACPDCPGCGKPPMFTVGVQAFCGNDECHIFCWSGAHSLDENLMDVEFIHLDGWLPQRPEERR